MSAHVCICVHVHVQVHVHVHVHVHGHVHVHVHVHGHVHVHVHVHVYMHACTRVEPAALRRSQCLSGSGAAPPDHLWTRTVVGWCQLWPYLLRPY